MPGLKPLFNILEELDLPDIPSFLLKTSATDPITSAAKFKRILGQDIFFSVDYRKDLLNNTIKRIVFDEIQAGKL